MSCGRCVAGWDQIRIGHKFLWIFAISSWHFQIINTRGFKHSLIRAAFKWRPSCDLPAGIQIRRIQDQHRTMLTHIPIWVMILQRWEVKVINTTISLTPDETKLKSPVERWSAVIKFNCYGFDSRSSVKSFQHLHLKIFTAKDKIEDFPKSNTRCTLVLHFIEVCACIGVGEGIMSTALYMKC